MRRRTHPNYQAVKDIIKLKLFPALRKQGFIARMNFSCCSTCASYELVQVAKARGKHRVVFYHRQEEDSFKHRGSVFLHYFANDNDTFEDTRDVGLIISENAKKVGLAVIWDENPDTCIDIGMAANDKSDG